MTAYLGVDLAWSARNRTGLAALDGGQDAETLFAAANLEEDWQAQQWGWEAEALSRRDARARGFALARDFALLARNAD